MAVRQTFRAFVDALEAVTVTGVAKHYTQGPPASLNTADLPAKFVMLPRGNESALVFGEHGGVQTCTADIVIAVVPNVQNIQGDNFDLTVDLMDNLMTAMMAMGLCSIRSKWRLNIRQTEIRVGEVAYWGIIATVEA